MKKQNVGEKYLKQKKITPLEIVFIVFAAVGAILYVARWIYYGVIALAIGIPGLIFTRSVKIKDSEFDALRDRILINKRIEIQKENVLESYEAESDVIVVGKDKKPRSRYYCISELHYGNTSCDVTVHTLDMCQMSVDTKKYSIPYTCQAQLEEKDIMTDVGRKKIYHISVAECDFKIPVSAISMDTDNFISHFNTEA